MKHEPGLRVPRELDEPGAGEMPGAPDAFALPVMPGFREMALRRMSDERRRLVADLTEQRRSAGLSQTEVAARMGTSQSAVARLESGDADVRVSTLERYAAAIGSQLAWQARAQASAGADPAGPDPVGPGLMGPGHAQAGYPRSGQPGAGLGREGR
jgi:DNA-binding XRE family transcriptional regulator